MAFRRAVRQVTAMTSRPQSLRNPGSFLISRRTAVDMNIPNSYQNIRAISDMSVSRATADIPDTLKVNITRQDEIVGEKDMVAQEVILPTAEGEIGILPGHEYTVTRVDAGIILIKREGQERRYVTAGGFAHINDNGTVDVNTVECLSLSDIDFDKVKQELEACKAQATSGNEQDRLLASYGQKLYERLEATQTR